MTAKKLIAFVFAFMLGLMFTVTCCGEDFGTDYDKAKAASAKDGKNLIVAIGAKW